MENTHPKAVGTTASNVSNNIKIKESLIYEAFLAFFYKNHYLTETEVASIKHSLVKDKPSPRA